MTDHEMLAKADAALAEEFELPLANLHPGALFREDLGLDSLDAVDMVIALERALGVKIGRDPAIMQIHSVADLHVYLLDKKRSLESAGAA